MSSTKLAEKAQKTRKQNLGVAGGFYPSETDSRDLGTEFSKQDESRLIRKAKRDREAFGQLYERYVRKIYTYIYYRTGNHDDAEDLTSKVFQKAQIHIVSYQDKGLPFSAWLYRIAHNLVANWHRDHGRRKFVDLYEAANYDTGERPNSDLELAEEKDKLLEAIRVLPEDKQQVLILKFAEELSNSEIGEIMGRSEGAIKSLYHRTLLTLRDRLEEEE